MFRAGAVVGLVWDLPRMWQAGTVTACIVSCKEERPCADGLGSGALRSAIPPISRLFGDVCAITYRRRVSLLYLLLFQLRTVSIPSQCLYAVFTRAAPTYEWGQ